MANNRVVSLVVLLLAAVWCGVSMGQDWTVIHQDGYCTMHGECMRAGLRGMLNCAYNGPAFNWTEFDDSQNFIDTLTGYCGEKYRSMKVCCDMDQITTMIESIAMSQQFIENCPACFQNMKQFWCDLTCLPSQSLIANVTALRQAPSGKWAVDAVDYYVTDEFAAPFYDSCDEVKYGQSNSYAMDMIGGGADNYRDFLKYMGEPKTLGSPFNITFVWDDDVEPVMEPMNPPYYNCYDEGEFKCTCVDCSDTCVLEPIPEEKEPCVIGSMDCLAFSLLIIYLAMIFFFIIITAFVYFRYSRNEKDIGITNAEKGAINRELHEWKIYVWLQRFFFKLGTFVAKHPCLVIIVDVILVTLCCVGLINFQVETDPVNLWSSPSSDTYQQKQFFDNTFAPFYRAAQVIMSLPDSTVIPPDDNQYISRLFDIENAIIGIVADHETSSGEIIQVTFQDICLKPLMPVADHCVLQSVTSYWQQDKEYFENDSGWYAHLRTCLFNPTYPGYLDSGTCLPLYGDPAKPHIVLGGFEGEDYLNATALVANIIIENKVDEEYIQMATSWEREMVALMKTIAAENPDVRITFYTESSVEDELASQSKGDITTIALSYLLMFLYASLALGNFHSVRRFFIDTKFTLGISGVLICLVSVVAAVGIFSAFGVKTSLIIAEVIPFLVLAVGVDNVFMMVHTFDRLDKNLSVEERAALALGEVGPSITLSTISETIAFSLGAIVSMPAVYSFASFSALAIFIDFLLQITMFVGLMTLDARRTESKRIDCIPCVKVPSAPDTSSSVSDGLLETFIRNFYTPFIMHPISKLVVVFGFIGALFFFISYIPYILLGLDQSQAVPNDSYLISYFDDQANLLRVGVPVYFVVVGGNATTLEGQRQLCALRTECDSYSVTNMIAVESMRPEYSYIALSPAMWMDDFIGFLNPDFESCCRVSNTSETGFCQPNEINPLCSSCLSEEEYDSYLLGPIGTEFMHYLNAFLEAVPGEDCGLAGRAGYATAISPDHENTTIYASHFRTYHTVLQTQNDYIQAYKHALRISDEIMEEHPDLEIFPYAMVYVYFEQYITIVSVTVFLIILCLIAIFAVTVLILGSPLSAIWVIIPTLMIVLDLLGIMAIWDISLNAVSLVNVIMGLGISVEFCSHITRSYTVHRGTRDERARKALNDIGGSVFSGITVTKFIGVIVLAFANSEIFIIYYFRMYLSIVLLGFAHGLVLLPILLSYFGPTTSVRVTSPDGNEAHVLLDEDDSYAQKASSAKLIQKEQEQRNAFYGSTNSKSGSYYS